MNKLEDEARELAKNIFSYDKNVDLPDNDEEVNTFLQGYIKGAKSNYVKRKILKSKLNLLRNFYYGEDLKDKDILSFYGDVYVLIEKDLKERLKTLE